MSFRSVVLSAIRQTEKEDEGSHFLTLEIPIQYLFEPPVSSFPRKGSVSVRFDGATHASEIILLG